MHPLSVDVCRKSTGPVFEISGFYEMTCSRS